MKHMSARILLCAVLTVAAMAPAGAARGPVLAQAAADVGADRAASAAREATGGRVLGVRRVEFGERAAYEIKVLLPGGRVRVVQVDARSGAVR